MMTYERLFGHERLLLSLLRRLLEENTMSTRFKPKQQRIWDPGKGGCSLKRGDKSPYGEGDIGPCAAGLGVAQTRLEKLEASGDIFKMKLFGSPKSSFRFFTVLPKELFG